MVIVGSFTLNCTNMHISRCCWIDFFQVKAAAAVLYVFPFLKVLMVQQQYNVVAKVINAPLLLKGTESYLDHKN